MKLSEDEARGFAVAYEAFCEALINVPSTRTVEDAQHVARALGSTSLDGFCAGAGMTQRYYDRFFVPTSSVHIPLSEARITGASNEEAGISYGPEADGGTEHAAASYRAAGFDPHALAGDPLAVGGLAPDSLAAELAYLAFLKQGSLESGGAEVYDRFACAFLSAHKPRWVKKAAGIMADQDDDFYARVVALAAQVMEEDLAALTAADAA